MVAIFAVAVARLFAGTVIGPVACNNKQYGRNKEAEQIAVEILL